MKNFDPATVLEHEHGVVRVFWVGRPLNMRQGETLTHDDIRASLGVTHLNAADVFQAWNTDWPDTSLIDVLRQGYDVNEADIVSQESELAAMDEIEGIIIIIRSSAFVDRPAKINLDGTLIHVASLREPDASVTFEPLPDGGAQGVITDAPAKKKPSDAAMSGRIATIALIIMALLVWVMIKIAG